MRVATLLALLPTAAALRPVPRDAIFEAVDAARLDLFEAAALIVAQAGNAQDVEKLIVTRDWAPMEASVAHGSDGFGAEVSDVYTVRVRFGDAEPEAHVSSDA